MELPAANSVHSLRSYTPLFLFMFPLYLTGYMVSHKHKKKGKNVLYCRIQHVPLKTQSTSYGKNPEKKDADS